MISGPACRLLVAVIGMFCAAAVASAISPEEDDPPADEKAAAERLSEIFNQHVFRGQKPQEAREGLEKQLRRHLVQIRGLTPAQLQKLELAGRVEVKHVFDGFDARRRAFESVDANPADAAIRTMDLELLRIAYEVSATAVLLGEHSLVHKTALATLQPDQLERYRSQLQERRRRRLLGVQESISRVVDQGGPLDGDQQRKLLELWNETPCTASGHTDAMVFLYSASRIPEKRYRDILDDRQWDVLQSFLATAQHYGPALVQLGLIDEPPQDNP
jgi:hypothetical protein